MPLSENDRQRIISALDTMDNAAAQIVIATFEAFARWLSRELPAIFARVRQEVQNIWRAIRTALA